MMLERLYALFRSLYNTPSVPDDIAPFLLSKSPRNLAKKTGTLCGHRISDRESVFLFQGDGDIELGIYIHPDILHRLQKNPRSWNIDDVGCVAEGVSHFLYLAHRAMEQRPCSVLELELQAEVDKFLALHLLSLETRGTASPALFHHQFQTSFYDHHLTEEEIDRYETASHFAAKYCRKLREKFFFPLRLHQLTQEVRPFFHRGFQEKIQNLIP